MCEPRFAPRPDSKEDSTQLLRQAREFGWFETVLSRFADSQETVASILDWQRTSWLSLLGLGPEGVALVVGGGYGLITHALAKTLGEVYMAEPLPERVEFTRIRLEQEGIANGHLVQSSPFCLPFRDRSFDLIVVDGMPETSRTVKPAKNTDSMQSRFLSQARRLLKDTGLLVIVSKNRFASAGWLGKLGRSDSAGTANSPEGPVRRTRGYQRLLATNGFGAVRFYWADPDFSDHYSLVPLENSCLSFHLRERLCEFPRFSRAWCRSWVKLLLARMGLVDLFAKSFVVFAWKKPCLVRTLGTRLWERVERALPESYDLSESVATVRTGILWARSVMRVFSPRQSGPRLILKSSSYAQGSREYLQAEFRHLSLVRARLERESHPIFSAPRPLGYFEIGSTCYSIESLVDGLPLSVLLAMQSPHLRFEFLRHELQRCIEVAVELDRVLRGEASAPRQESYGLGPSEMLVRFADKVPVFDRLLQLVELRGGWTCEEDTDCVQHGDFTIENIFKQPRSAELAIIDWAELVRGVPRLYDVFTLLLSVVPWLEAEEKASGEMQSLLGSQFFTTFFGRGRSAELFRTLLRVACAKLSVPESLVWDRFICFLALRIEHYFLRIHPLVRNHPAFVHPMARECANFLVLALRHREQFIL